MQRYIGRVVTHDPAKHCGFVSLASVVKDDRSAHGLATSQDIFVHQDDCDAPLKQGADLAFEVVPDQRRSGDALRAVGANLVVGELVLAGDDLYAGKEIANPRDLYVPKTPAQYHMKPIPREDVERVLANRPLANVPRTGNRKADPKEAAELTRQLLERVFPQFIPYGADYSGGSADQKFDEAVTRAVKLHRDLGMGPQANLVSRQAKQFKSVRAALTNASEEGYIRPDTIIPIRYLPDLFMAVPVWYWCANPQSGTNTLDEYVTYFANLFPSKRWSDTFLAYNPRARLISRYQGDIIPPKILERIFEADVFDRMVIMTPYHDVVGGEWDNPAWVRSVDPYLVGFARGMPYMFVLGRFSDSGFFPLHSELVADTLAFLRQNISRLKNFNRQEIWYQDGQQVRMSKIGDRLHTNFSELLRAFDAGIGFDWLRGEADLPAAQ